MMPKINDKKYALLEERIRSLEEENNLLSDRAEETFLLRLVTEALNEEEDIPILIQNILEKTSILKSIPFIAMCKIQQDNINLLGSYCSFCDESGVKNPVILSKKYMSELGENADLIYADAFNAEGISFNFDKKYFDPYAVLIIPFKCPTVHHGYFVFIDDQVDKNKLSSVSLVLQQITHMMVQRLENIYLLKELQSINAELEDKISSRTVELINTNQSLKNEILERKNTEEALRISEEKYRTLFNTEKDAIIILDLHTSKIVDANDATVKLYGYSKEELLTMSAIELSNNVDLSSRNIKGMIDNSANIVKSQYNTHKKRDGSTFPVEITAGKFVLKGKPIAYAVFRDISERYLAEEKIRQLSQSVEQSPVSVVITDIEGNIEYINPQFIKTTGYGQEEVCGKNPRILKSDQKSSEQYKELWETITAGNIWRGEFHNKKKNGELYWEFASISPIKNAEGKTTHYVAVKEDITERKNLQQRLLQSQKMESVGTLAGGIAHDFNNLLTIINGHAELVLNKMNEDNPLYKDVKLILANGDRASNLTRQLLTFSRKQFIKPEVIDLNNTIEELNKMITRLIGEDIKIIKKLDPGIPKIKADNSQIEQILINLLVNARDALQNGDEKSSRKEIEIATSLLSLDEELALTLPDLSPGDYICFSIKDNGSGIHADIKNKIFEPFFTTKGKSQGTGLGLATIYGIVKQNKGSIQMESEIDKGTIFKIFWPASTESLKIPVQRFKDKKETVSSGKEIILYVEDDDAVLNLGVLILNKSGYTVYSASNGLEAIDLVKKNNLKFDLLITDLIMPGMDGKELALNIEKIYPEMKIIFTSGYTDDRIGLDDINIKRVNFINKPYSIKSLTKKVREILDT